MIQIPHCGFSSLFSARLRPLVCADIQADVEDGQLQYFYLLAFVLQGNIAAQTFLLIAVSSDFRSALCTW